MKRYAGPATRLLSGALALRRFEFPRTLFVGSPFAEKNASRKFAEQARCATLPSATGCGRAHRCDESQSLFANYKGMRCHVPQTLPLGRSHNRDEAHQVTEKPINDAQYRS